MKGRSGMEKGQSFSIGMKDNGYPIPRGSHSLRKSQEVHVGCNHFLFFAFVIVKGKKEYFKVLSNGADKCRKMILLVFIPQVE